MGVLACPRQPTAAGRRRRNVLWLMLCASTVISPSAGSPLVHHPQYNGEGHRVGGDGRRLFVRQSVDLLRWTLNMNSGSFTMSFNAGMDVSTLNASAIVIQRSQTRADGDPFVRLSENTTSASSDGPDLSVKLSPEDWYALQRAHTIGTAAETSWIVLDVGAVRDLANTESNALANGAAQQAATFQKDYTSPRLVVHDLDMNGAGSGASTVGFLTLQFDEVVDTTTFDPAGITLRQYPNFTDRTLVRGLPEGDSISLTSASYTISPNNTIITVTIGQADMDAIKLKKDIAVSNTTAAITMRNTTIRDMNAMQLFPITKEVERYYNPYTNALEYESAYPVRNFIADTTGPRVIFYALDINAGLLRITFDEAVDLATFDVTQFVIQQAVDGTGSSHRLSPACTTPSSSGPSLIVVLHSTDMTSIATDTALAVSRFTSYLSFSTALVSDLAANPVAAVQAAAALKVDRYIVVGLTEYTLDLNQDQHTTDGNGARDGTVTYGHLTLVYNGVVDVSTLDVTQLTLQYKQTLGAETVACSGVTGDCTKYTLTAAGSVLHSSTATDGTTVRILLNAADLNQIKLRPLLATSDQNVFIVMGSKVVLDVPGDDVTPFTEGDLLSPPKQIKTGGFTADTAKPYLHSYDIDMNIGTLTFKFSEAVNASSLNTTLVTLQNDAVAANIAITGAKHTLGTDSFTASPNGLDIVLTLSVADLHTLKTMRTVAIDQAHTYLVMAGGAIRDMAGNPLIEVGTGLNPGDNSPRKARLVAGFTQDVTAPLLTGGRAGVRAVTTSFFADMERGVLILTFSEPVDPVTFDPTGVVLANNSYANGTTYRLSNQSYALLTDPFSRVALLRTSAVQYTLAYVLSTNDRSVYNLDFADNVVYNNQSLRLQAVLQDPLGTVAKQKLHALTSNVIAIQLATADLNNIATFTTLGTSKQNTFLILDAKAIKDMAGNAVTPIVGENATASGVPTPAPAPGADAPGALSTVYFNADSGRPRLESYTIDMNVGQMTMQFSEAMSASTLDVTKLTFVSKDTSFASELGSTAAEPASTYTLQAVTTTQTPSTTSSPDGAAIVVKFGTTDLNGLKRIKDLAKSLNSTNLIVKSGMIADMSGFDCTPINEGNVLGAAPLKAAQYTPDTTPPVLVRAKVDFPRRRLRLTFSEAVDIDTISLPALQLQQTAQRSSSNRFFALTTDSKVVDPTAGAYCAGLYATQGQDTPHKPALIHKGATCAMLDQRTGVQYELFSKNVDIDIHIGEADAQGVLAAWPPGTVASDITEGPPPNVFVALHPAFVSDFAAPPPNEVPPTSAPASGRRRLAAAATGNQVVAISAEAAVAVSVTQCGACAPPSFLWRACGLLDDRLCSRCTVCPYDHYTIRACSITQDTECHRCASCTHGKFVVQPCGGGVVTAEGTTTLWTGYTAAGNLVSDPTKAGRDTVCRRCRDCNANTFETRRCELGLDRQCQTCDSCTLTTDQEAKCRGQSWVWRRINCCYDEDKNQVKPCKDVPLENFKISARDSRRDEVWCYKFNRDKKQCEDEMYQNGEEPVGGHIDETEYFDGTSTRYKEDGRRIHLQDTNIPVQSYGDAADTNRVIPATVAPHESNVHPGRHARQQTGTQNVDTNRFYFEVADLPETGVAAVVAEENKVKKLTAVLHRYPTPKGFNTGY